MNKTGTIYIIKCKDTKIKDCYIGSTINLKRRKIQQKSCYKNPNSNRGHLKLYQFMREDKQYKEDNKDKIKKQNKEYQKKNQKNIKKQRKIYREKNKGNINCNCGSTISKLNYLTHCKTKKHLQYIENNN